MLNDVKRLLKAVSFRLAWGLLVAPWFLLALAFVLGRLTGSLIGTLLRLRLAFATHLRCPNGHRSAMLGLFECRGCGALFAGWAFQRCPVCGDSCGYVNCEHCGMAVRNPFL